MSLSLIMLILTLKWHNFSSSISVILIVPNKSSTYVLANHHYRVRKGAVSIDKYKRQRHSLLSHVHTFVEICYKFIGLYTTIKISKQTNLVQAMAWRRTYQKCIYAVFGRGESTHQSWMMHMYVRKNRSLLIKITAVSYSALWPQSQSMMAYGYMNLWKYISVNL